MLIRMIIISLKKRTLHSRGLNCYEKNNCAIFGFMLWMGQWNIFGFINMICLESIHCFQCHPWELSETLKIFRQGNEFQTLMKCCERFQEITAGDIACPLASSVAGNLTTLHYLNKRLDECVRYSIMFRLLASAHIHIVVGINN